jgi:hypothetical protein
LAIRADIRETPARLLPQAIMSGRSRNRPQVRFTDYHAAYLALKSSCHYRKRYDAVVLIPMQHIIRAAMLSFGRTQGHSKETCRCGKVASECGFTL